MSKHPKEPQIEERRLDQLQDHPLQRRYFGAYNQELIERLAADIEQHDLRELIDILPRNAAKLPVNTILRGHKRRLALKLLGRSVVKLRVRYDLTNATPAMVEQFVLQDNFDRQQLDPLDRARVGLRLLEIERGRAAGGLHISEQAEARERVGLLLGMSGRNLSRYWAVLRTPIEVQRAYQSKALKLTTAAKISTLNNEAQTEIAERLAAGEPAAQVVEDYIGAKVSAAKQAKNALRVFLRGLKRCGELQTGLAYVGRQQLVEYVDLLKAGRTTIATLLRRVAEGDDTAPDTVSGSDDEYCDN